MVVLVLRDIPEHFVIKVSLVYSFYSLLKLKKLFLFLVILQRFDITTKEINNVYYFLYTPFICYQRI